MKIVYQNKYVAFIDVLGFSELVDSKNPDKKSKLEAYFTRIESAFENYDVKKAMLEKYVVSDSIILAVEDSEDGFRLLLNAVRMLQSSLSVLDIWVRGGISFGEVFFKKEPNIVVGEGYIKAYLLEKQASFPRIIIDPRIFAKLNLTMEEFYRRFNGPISEDYRNEKLIHGHELSNAYRLNNNDANYVCYASHLITEAMQGKLYKGEKSLNVVYKNLRTNLYSSQAHYAKYLWLKNYFLEVILLFKLTRENDAIHGPMLRKIYDEFHKL